MLAPLHYRYFGFPLEQGTDVLRVDRVCECAHALIDRAEAEGDEALFGDVPHWAHILKTESGPDGTWPAAVDARTGDAIGAERTRAPALLLARLGALLHSSEFENAAWP